MIQKNNTDCHTDDWKRTEPDHVVYLPKTEDGSDGYADHFVVADTHGVGVGPQSLVWLAMYASLTEHKGKRIFWYPDRKHFLLGKVISDELLADMRVPD